MRGGHRRGVRASAAAVLVTGTHFSTQGVADASFKAMKLARKHGRRVALTSTIGPICGRSVVMVMVKADLQKARS